MHFLVMAVGTAAAMASSALAGTSFVHNKCDFDVWVTSVGATTGETTQVPNGTYYSEKQYFEKVGTAIKITKTQQGLYDGKPVLHFSYTYAQNRSIYYDLSSINGFDFTGKKLRIHGPEGGHIEEIEWDGEPKPNHTAVFLGDTNLTLELCE